MKRTKIVCTVGPSTDGVETFKEMINAGMNVMRLNFSHGDYEGHKKKIVDLRQAAEEVHCNVAILLDTKGPEIRTMNLVDGKDVFLSEGTKFTLTTDQTVLGDKTRVAVTYPGLPNDLTVGNIVLIDDGLISLTIDELTETEVRCTVNNSGLLGQYKGVNLPKASVQLPALSPKDIEDLKFGCDNNVDFVAASFVRKASDVIRVREVLDRFGGTDIKIISKIENEEGILNFNEILDESDGIMVARGDLGVEIPVEDVPFEQKSMIHKCNAAGKVVITATQMLESMIANPRPTRAEAGDVANAILDGTDAVMLSGETAKGKYPIEAISVMSKIACKADSMIRHKFTGCASSINITEAVAQGTVEAAETLNAKWIIVATETGRAALAIRRYCPTAPIYAITNNDRTARQLMLSRGIQSKSIAGIPTIDEFHKLVDKLLKQKKMVDLGDIVVVSCGENIFKPGTTNNFKVHVVK